MSSVARQDGDTGFLAVHLKRVTHGDLVPLPGLSNYQLDHRPDLSHSSGTDESAATLIELDNKKRRMGVVRCTDRVKKKKKKKRGQTTRPVGNCAFLSFGGVTE